MPRYTVGMDLEHTNDLNLYIHLDQFLRQRIYLHQAWIDSAIEATEFGD